MRLPAAHVAAQRGQLPACRICLLSDYNVIDEKDEMDNSVIHTAAANGHSNILKALLEYGADTHTTNVYNLTPLQVASNEKCRNLLRVAMKNQTILTGEEKTNRRKDQNKRFYEMKSKVLSLAENGIKEESTIQQIIRDAEEFGIPQDILEKARTYLHWLSIEHKIQLNADRVEDEAPFNSSSKDFQVVLDLQSIIQTTCEKGSEISDNVMPKSLINTLEEANELCSKSKAEIDLHSVCRRMKSITCASEIHMNLIEILKKTRDKAKQHKGDKYTIDEAGATLRRFETEIDLKKKLHLFPEVRLPLRDMTPKQEKSFFQSEDLGFIKENEEYPLPPADGTGYIWVTSESLQLLNTATEHLEEAIAQAKLYSCNADLLNLSEEMLCQKKIDVKALEEKDDLGRAAAILIAEKAAKKLQKRKKK